MTLPKKITDIKGKVALDELWRAHIIIVVLALALALLLLLTIAQPTQISALLGWITIVLVLFVAFISLKTAFGLKRRK